MPDFGIQSPRKKNQSFAAPPPPGRVLRHPRAPQPVDNTPVAAQIGHAAGVVGGAVYRGADWLGNKATEGITYPFRKVGTGLAQAAFGVHQGLAGEPVNADVFTPPAADASRPARTATPRNQDPASAPVQMPDATGSGMNHAPPFGGRNINGVLTFSDGSGNTPRTVSDAQMKAAAGQLQSGGAHPFAGPARPEDVLGRTPSSAEMATTRMQRIFNPSANTTTTSRRLVNPAERQRMARATMAEIANGDWRTPLGTAAHNLRVSMGSGTPRERRDAEMALRKLYGAGAQGMQDADTLQNTDRQEIGATNRTGITQQNSNLRTSAQQRGQSARLAATLGAPQEVTLANGGLGFVYPRTRQVAAATFAGQPVRAVNGKAQTRTQQIIDKLRDNTVKAATAAEKALLPDANGKPQHLTPTQIAQVRYRTALEMGLPMGVDPQTGQILVSVNGTPMRLNATAQEVGLTGAPAP